MDADHIRQAAKVISGLDEAERDCDEDVVAALAAAGMLKAPDDEIVTPEQRAALDAAAIVVDEWVIRGDRMVSVATQIGLVAAVDALRATTKDGE